MTLYEKVDSWIREIFLWTFEHETVSLWGVALPIYIWIVVGLIAVLMMAAENENNEWKRAITVIGTYVLVPIIYFFSVGYIGFQLYN